MSLFSTILTDPKRLNSSINMKAIINIAYKQMNQLNTFSSIDHLSGKYVFSAMGLPGPELALIDFMYVGFQCQLPPFHQGHHLQNYPDQYFCCHFV